MTNLDVRIATRKSALALWQAEHTKGLLEQHGAKVTLVPLVTSGDRLQTGALAAENVTASQTHLTTGKGLFVKEIQEALLRNEADLAVHSMKDLPVFQTEGLEVYKLLERADPRDVLILSENLRKRIHADDVVKTLQSEAKLRIGTVSARRSFLLKRIIGKNVTTEILRGNVDTRLKKVRAGDFDAIILAKAGLDRLGLFSSKDMHILEPSEFIPAAAQGVAALETRADDSRLKNLLNKISSNCSPISIALERLVLHALGGDCQMAVAAHCIGKSLHVGWEKGTRDVIAHFDISEEWSDLHSSPVDKGYATLFANYVASDVGKHMRHLLASSGFEVIP